MTLPALTDLEGVDGARVLTRLDLNVPISDGIVQDDTRIVAALPTLTWLAKRVSVIAACSHLGKAKGTPDPAFSLAPVAPVLAEALGRPVIFVEDCLDVDVESAEPGTLFLLENLRFYPGEKGNDADFAATLTAGFTHYVNDAFGTAHRKHGSVSAAPQCFAAGRKAAGLLMEREVAALDRVVHSPAQPFVAAVGGAKISTKTAPLEALMDRVRTLLIGGGMANTFLKAQGHGVGRSLVEDEMLSTARTVMARAAERGIELLIPTDVVVTDDLEQPSLIETVAPDAVPGDLMIVDLGPESRRRYADAIGGAETVFWNGPMGVFEIDAFAAGTMAVAEAMASCAGFTVVGGGESVMAIRRAGVVDAIDHVSTGGGASLSFLTGEQLPALAALEV
ncbi:MAG: phosphoglycerate kinase [Thermoanaerobaculales bacterium]|jgi:phosphoglycerate kinase|nr:phosphoglycerate kinase [Thermoanaerobaculales bacterium]